MLRKKLTKELVEKVEEVEVEEVESEEGKEEREETCDSKIGLEIIVYYKRRFLFIKTPRITSNRITPKSINTKIDSNPPTTHHELCINQHWTWFSLPFYQTNGLNIP